MGGPSPLPPTSIQPPAATLLATALSHPTLLMSSTAALALGHCSLSGTNLQPLLLVPKTGASTDGSTPPPTAAATGTASPAANTAAAGVAVAAPASPLAAAAMSTTAAAPGATATSAVEANAEAMRRCVCVCVCVLAYAILHLSESLPPFLCVNNVEQNISAGCPELTTYICAPYTYESINSPYHLLTHTHTRMQPRGQGGRG
jgi:hypothetical protein